MYTKKINEISLRKPKAYDEIVYNTIAIQYQYFPELRKLMLEIVKEIDVDDAREMANQLSGIVKYLNIVSIRNAFKNALRYLEKTQTDEVLTNVNNILNGKIGDTVFDLLDHDRITKVKDKDTLIEIIDFYTKLRGNKISLNSIDVSGITDMSNLFYSSEFNGDISKWDVSNVKDMSYMFAYSSFNSDISKWNVSNVKDMSHVFYSSDFNGDISKWDVSNVKDMSYMVADSSFNSDISKWNVSNVKDIEDMFVNSPLEDKPEYQPKFED